MIVLAFNPRLPQHRVRYYAQRCAEPAYAALGLDYIVTEGRAEGAPIIGYHTTYAFALATAQALNRQRDQVAHEPLIFVPRPDVAPRSN